MGEKDKILQYLEFKGITKNRFYKDTGLSNGFLDKGTSIGVDKLRIVLDNYRDLNPMWFINEQENMILSNNYEIHSDREDQYTLMEPVPLYNIEAHAGVTSIFSDDVKTAPVDFLRIPNLPKCDGAIYVTGDSMYPLIKSGDIVIYKQIHDLQTGIFYGMKYIVSLNLDGDDFILVKYVQKSDKGEDWICLVSENRHHQPKDVQLSSVRAMALIKATFRYETIS